jgi:hypothetical protein
MDGMVRPPQQGASEFVRIRFPLFAKTCHSSER